MHESHDKLNRKYSSAKALISVGSFFPVLARNVAACLLQWHLHVCRDDIIFSLFCFISFAIAFYFILYFLIYSSFISSINSLFTSEKLFTKFNGFCISWAMPAVSSPRMAIFSDWMSWDWVDFKFFSTCLFNFHFGFLLLPVIAIKHECNK